MLYTTTLYHYVSWIFICALFIVMTRSLSAQSAPWTSVGPYRGTVSSFASIGNSLFAGTGSNGVFKSTDNGDSWQQVSFQFESNSAPQVISHGTFLFVAGVYVYRSADDGETWTEINPNMNHSVEGISFIDDTLYAIMRSRNNNKGDIYRSHDFGESWEAAGQFIGQVSESYSSPSFTSHGSSLFLMNGSFQNNRGLYRSDDGGATWDTVHVLGENNFRAVAAHDSVLVVVAGYKGIYCSMDFGSTWIHRDNIVPSDINYVTWDNDRFIATGRYPGCVFVSDNGMDWQKINVGLVGSINTIYAQGTMLFAGCSGNLSTGNWNQYEGEDGIYRSTDNGTTWQFSSRGFSNIHIQGIAEQDGVLFAAGDDGIYLSRDNGSEWVRPPARLGFEEVMSIAATSDALLVGMYNGRDGLGGGIYRTKDAGASWTRVGPGLPWLPVPFLTASGNLVFTVITDLSANPYRRRLYSSIDGGITWSARQLPTGIDFQIYDIKFIDTSLFLATQRSIYRSLDTGMTWQSVNNGLGNSLITTINGTKGMLLAGSIILDSVSASIFRSADNGASWQPVYSSDIPQDRVNDFASYGNAIIASFSRSGVMRSTDNGDIWIPFNNGLINRNVMDVEFVGDNLVCVVYSGGMYRTSMLSSVKSKTEPAEATTATLYPNPCHGSATIRYDVLPGTDAGKMPVVLSLHNMLGEEIDVILDQHQVQGSYNMQIDVSGLAPGTYFYQVKAGTRYETHPFIVIDR